MTHLIPTKKYGASCKLHEIAVRKYVEIHATCPISVTKVCADFEFQSPTTFWKSIQKSIFFKKDNRKNNFRILFGLQFESVFFKNLLENSDFEFRRSIFDLRSDSYLMPFSTEGLCENRFSSSVTRLAIIILEGSTKEPDRAACYDKRFI